MCVGSQIPALRVGDAACASVDTAEVHAYAAMPWDGWQCVLLDISVLDTFRSNTRRVVRRHACAPLGPQKSKDPSFPVSWRCSDLDWAYRQLKHHYLYLH